MTTSNQLTPGMTLSINNQLYKVESSSKVSVPKGTSVIRARLKDMRSNEIIEKDFKLNQPIKDVTLLERKLEFLYIEGADFLFLDIVNLNQVLVSAEVVGAKVHYLKEGTEVKAFFYDDIVFALELPHFLELMVVKTQFDEEALTGHHLPLNETSLGETQFAVLETGARIEVPPFIRMGDIIKVDTEANAYIQRV